MDSTSPSSILARLLTKQSMKSTDSALLEASQPYAGQSRQLMGRQEAVANVNSGVFSEGISWTRASTTKDRTVAGEYSSSTNISISDSVLDHPMSDSALAFCDESALVPKMSLGATVSPSDNATSAPDTFKSHPAAPNSNQEATSSAFHVAFGTGDPPSADWQVTGARSLIPHDTSDPASKQSSESPTRRSRSRVCSVCSFESATFHLSYGASACLSCRAFFRRIVNKGTDPSTLVCNSDADADVDVSEAVPLLCAIHFSQTNKCMSCRFRACLMAGMRTEAVLDEAKKEVWFRKKNRREKAAASRVKSTRTTRSTRAGTSSTGGRATTEHGSTSGSSSPTATTDSFSLDQTAPVQGKAQKHGSIDSASLGLFRSEKEKDGPHRSMCSIGSNIFPLIQETADQKWAMSSISFDELPPFLERDDQQHSICSIDSNQSISVQGAASQQRSINSTCRDQDPLIQGGAEVQPSVNAIRADQFPPVQEGAGQDCVPMYSVSAKSYYHFPRAPRAPEANTNHRDQFQQVSSLYGALPERNFESVDIESQLKQHVNMEDESMFCRQQEPLPRTQESSFEPSGQPFISMAQSASLSDCDRYTSSMADDFPIRSTQMLHSGNSGYQPTKCSLEQYSRSDVYFQSEGSSAERHLAPANVVFSYTQPDVNQVCSSWHAAVACRNFTNSKERNASIAAFEQAATGGSIGSQETLRSAIMAQMRCVDLSVDTFAMNHATFLSLPDCDRSELLRSNRSLMAHYLLARSATARTANEQVHWLFGEKHSAVSTSTSAMTPEVLAGAIDASEEFVRVYAKSCRHLAYLCGGCVPAGLTGAVANVCLFSTGKDVSMVLLSKAVHDGERHAKEVLAAATKGRVSVDAILNTLIKMEAVYRSLDTGEMISSIN